MNTPETDVIGGPYIEREDGVEQPIMAFKEFEDIYFASRYSKWIWSLPEPELERRKEIVKQQLDNDDSGSIITS